MTKPFRCNMCYSTNIYTLKDGTKVCRKCGNREKSKKVKKDGK